MSKLPTKEDLLKVSKPLPVNLEVAKTIDSKTQTRRLAKSKSFEIIDIKDEEVIHKRIGTKIWTSSIEWFIDVFAQYKVNDILWIREPAKVIMYNLESTILPNNWTDIMTIKYLSDNSKFTLDIPNRFYKRKRDDYCDYPTWILNSQGIPNGCIKEMARTFIKITNVRVERLKDITISDVIAEGIEKAEDKLYRAKSSPMKQKLYYTFSWENLWNLTAPKGYKWEDNPYIFVYEFEKVEYKC